MRALLDCLFVMIVLGLISCSDEASPIGSDFFDGRSLNMITVDTITVGTSTIIFDSLITNDATRLLVGSHNDVDLGVLSCMSFFQMGIAGPFSIDKEFTTFTRAELRLVHDGYSYYDTLTPISLSVHELKEQLDFPTTYPYLYNTSNFKYDPTPMGSTTYKSRPGTKDTVKISLPEAFGRDVIRLAQASAVQVSTSGEFLGYFYGLAVVPSGTDGPIVGFATNAEVRVYYMDKSQTPGVERYLAIQGGDFLRFNRITSDRSATDLDGLTVQRYQYSSKITDGKSYMQSGLGLGLRVSMPYLRNILIDNPGLTIVNAVLEIAPTRDNDGRNIVLPTELVMSSVDYQNELIEPYENTPTLNEDYYLGRNTHYEVDITAFIQQQLAMAEFNDNALVFTPSDASFRSAVDRLYAGDQQSERPVKLTLTCLTYSK